MKTLCTNYFLLRLTVLIAPIGIVDRANAACAPASPVNNVAVTCTGATANQNGSDEALVGVPRIELALN